MRQSEFEVTNNKYNGTSETLREESKKRVNIAEMASELDELQDHLK